MKMHHKAHRLLSLLLSLTVLLSCMVWQGVSAADGSIDLDFEQNPGDKYLAVEAATNNTYRTHVLASLETQADYAKSGTGAMKLAFLDTPTVTSAGPAFRILDGDDTAFAPRVGTYYRITFSYYVEKATCDFQFRLLFKTKNWSTTTDVSDSDGVVLATHNTAVDACGEWVTASTVVKCTLNRAHLALYAPQGGKAGTTVYLDDLTMTPLADASGVVPVTVQLNYEGASAVTEYAVAGEGYTPVSPLRSGYRLAGWYTDADCTAAYTGQVTGAATLYAGWEKQGTVSHPGMMDFESPVFRPGQSINLSVGTATVTDAQNHTGGGYYALQVSSSGYNEIAGNTRPQFNLTAADGTPLRAKAGENLKLSFWLYIPENAANINVRYWLTVTEETAGYTNQKNDEVVYETGGVAGTVGTWVQVITTVSALPRDGYLRLGICSQNEVANTFYIDDIQASLCSSDATVLDYENVSTESLDTIRRGGGAVSAAQNHTPGGSRALQLQGVSWGGYLRNQLILSDPATLQPYAFNLNEYYTVTMWMYTTVTGFRPNIWVWGTDDPTLAFNSAADKNDKTGFEYDGNVAAASPDGLLVAGEWTRVTFGIMPTNGKYMLMGITNGAVNGGGYEYYIDDVVIDKAPQATLTLHANGGTFTGGETATVTTYVGLQIPSDVEVPTREGYEFIGWHWDEKTNFAAPLTYVIDKTELTLYAGWRPWMGTCYHQHSCDVVCRICGEYGAHSTDGTWACDATGHWLVCDVCGDYVSGDLHSYTAACDGTCDACGYDRGASHTMVTCYTAAGHSLQCSTCGLTESFVAHTYADEADVACDVCGYTRYAVGDLDLDGDVDGEDATYLAYHLFFPEFYPVYSNGDVDRNGRINADDALYLKHHLQSPAEYPLDAPLAPVTGRDDRQTALG